MIQLYTDGASSGNPGLSGAGIYIKTSNEQMEYSLPLGVLTNHEAEFHAVIAALTICEKEYPDEIISLYADSQLVVEAIDKQFVKNKTYRPLLKKIQKTSASFPHFFVKWIPAKKNRADQLAKLAIHLNTTD